MGNRQPLYDFGRHILGGGELTVERRRSETQKTGGNKQHFMQGDHFEKV